MISRFEVRNGSQSGHCCFKATVVDTSKPEIINGEHYADDNGPQFEQVCECFDMAAAERIAAALNYRAAAMGAEAGDE